MSHENQTPPLFSVVIPACNAAACVRFAVDSVLAQTLPSRYYEIIVVDDCSTDTTRMALAEYAGHANFRVASTSKNGGPGMARNVGIELAAGQWIIFLDSDDRLMPDALAELHRQIGVAESQRMDLDAVGFNWAYVPSSDSQQVPAQGMRRDHVYLTAPRNVLLERYLALQTDGSVIFTALRREFLARHALRFEAGLHEDVDYLFYVYWHARALRYVDRILYGKVRRSESIVSTVSARHLSGFCRAWRAIGRFVELHGGNRREILRAQFLKGLTAVVATRVREIFRSADEEAAAKLYHCLFGEYQRAMADLGLAKAADLSTQYGMLARDFVEIMSRPSLSDAERAVQLNVAVPAILAGSWSCVDLHHSVFLAPDQIRTCCKRFFRDAEMKGDVVLMDMAKHPDAQFSSAAILAAKRGLHEAINRGDSTDCDGCPFLEFKTWGALEPLDIRYLSLEYHSVCNLKCSYCSDTYYGGAKAAYDVPALVDEFIDRGQLANCHTVVWGGGEPVLDANFTPLMEKLVTALPVATHRVLTNSVTFSKAVAGLLEQDRISVTSSVDAGTAKTFEAVRGRARLKAVMANLKRYVALQPRRVTVKYIFTKGNSTFDEVRSFVALVTKYELRGCSFQISSDFKEESISLELAVLMISLYGLLVKAGFKAVFFDDLLRFRLNDLHSEAAAEVHARLKSVGLESAIARYQDYPRVVIWGAGWQARYLVEKSNFLRRSEIAFFVDDTPEKIGTRYFDREVRSPAALLQCDLPVVIAAVQGYPFIYDALRRLGTLESRLITGLVF